MDFVSKYKPYSRLRSPSNSLLSGGCYFRNLTWKMKFCRERRADSSPLVLDS